MKTYSLIIFILISFSCRSQSQLDLFYMEIKKQFPTAHIIKKNIITNDDYYKDYIKFLSDDLNQKIAFSNPKNIAFDLIINDNIYRVNFIVFEIDKHHINSYRTGQFNTKALISYYYTEKKDKGYLLLFNKFITEKNTVVNKIISILNNQLLN